MSIMTIPLSLFNALGKAEIARLVGMGIPYFEAKQLASANLRSCFVPKEEVLLAEWQRDRDDGDLYV